MKEPVQILEIVRGTTNTFNISLKDATGEPYVLQTGEKLKFGVKVNPYSRASVYVVSKELTSSDYSSGYYVLTLNPNDTVGLEAGKYYYDIGLKTTNQYFMVVKCSPFIIEEAVTDWLEG